MITLTQTVDSLTIDKTEDLSAIEISYKGSLVGEILGNTISGMVALDKFGCWSLPRRICDIKETGFPIESQWITTDSGKRIKEYWMGKDQQELSF